MSSTLTKVGAFTIETFDNPPPLHVGRAIPSRRPNPDEAFASEGRVPRAGQTTDTWLVFGPTAEMAQYRCRLTVLFAANMELPLSEAEKYARADPTWATGKMPKEPDRGR